MEYPLVALSKAHHVALFKRLNVAVICSTPGIMSSIERMNPDVVLPAFERAGAHPFGRARVERAAEALNMDVNTMVYMAARMFILGERDVSRPAAKQLQPVVKTVISDDQVPTSCRLRTGIKNQTIWFPNQFVKKPEEHDFARLQGQYERIRDILARYNFKLELVGIAHNQKRGNIYCHNPKPGSYLVTFASWAGPKDNPLFVWEKYEGYTSGGGQNRVYINGEMIGTNSFVNMSDEALDELFAPLILKSWVCTPID